MPLKGLQIISWQLLRDSVHARNLLTLLHTPAPHAPMNRSYQNLSLLGSTYPLLVRPMRGASVVKGTSFEEQKKTGSSSKNILAKFDHGCFLPLIPCQHSLATLLSALFLFLRNVAIHALTETRTLWVAIRVTRFISKEKFQSISSKSLDCSRKFGGVCIHSDSKAFEHFFRRSASTSVVRKPKYSTMYYYHPSCNIVAWVITHTFGHLPFSVLSEMPICPGPSLKTLPPF